MMKSNSYNYNIWRRVHRKIQSYYTNVARKYKNTYSREMMKKNLRDAEYAMYFIEDGLARRVPTMARWSGYYMAHAKKWYYAYKIEGNNIIIVDACHERNMHD